MTVSRLEQMIWAGALVRHHAEGCPIALAIERADDLVLLVREEESAKHTRHGRLELELRRRRESRTRTWTGEREW